MKIKWDNERKFLYTETGTEEVLQKIEAFLIIINIIATL